MNNEGVRLRVASLAFTDVSTVDGMNQLVHAVIDLIGPKRWSNLGEKAYGEGERADKAEAALAAREVENATLRTQLENLRTSIVIRTPEDVAKLDNYKSVTLRLAETTAALRLVDSQVSTFIVEIGAKSVNGLATYEAALAHLREMKRQYARFEEEARRCGAWG